MGKLNIAKSGVDNFVNAMLTSAQENKEVKPQAVNNNVNEEQLQKIMTNLKKGIVRRERL